jgi:hypothetical protein
MHSIRSADASHASERHRTSHSICERLEKLNPVPGSVRIDDAEAIVRAQSLIAERAAGEAAETILHPDAPSPGAQHDFTAARAYDTKDAGWVEPLRNPSSHTRGDGFLETLVL